MEKFLCWVLFFRNSKLRYVNATTPAKTRDIEKIQFEVLESWGYII